MLLITFRHGLRVSELINMRIADVDLDTGRLFVRRLKRSLSSSQPLEGMRFAPCEHGCGSELTRHAAIRHSFFCSRFTEHCAYLMPWISSATASVTGGIPGRDHRVGESQLPE
jgi:hypothetical protein